MGQEESTPVDNSVPPETLSARTISAVADHIKSGKVKRICVMTGAGISTAAGIPDFRTPGTGLYANLARLDLPYAEAVFDISFFRKNPDPFYVLAHELYPGKFFPTISHAFIALLARKGLLVMLFTQNIDCLERRAGVPAEKIVEAHGSFATQRCIECKREFSDDKMKEHVESAKVPRCADEKCGGLVKPDIVFFGEALPSDFRDKSYHASTADVTLIIGTSLSVYPFASLPDMVLKDRPRVLFNMERVGNMGSRPDDVLVLGDCDQGIRKLASELGWEKELEKLWRGVVGDKEADRQSGNAKQHHDELEEEVAKLTEEVGAVLRFDGEEPGQKSEGADAKTEDATPKEDELKKSNDAPVPEKEPPLESETTKESSDKKDSDAQTDALSQKGQAAGPPAATASETIKEGAQTRDNEATKKKKPETEKSAL